MIKRYPFPDNRWFRIGFGFFLFAMLYLARNTMVSQYLLGFYKAQFVYLVLLAVLGAAFLWTNRKQLKEIVLDGRIVVMIFSTVCILTPMLFKRDWQMTYFSILLAIYTAIFLTYFLSVQQAARYYVMVVAVLSVISLVTTYLLRIPADAGILVPPVFTTEFDTSVYNYGLSFVSVDFVKERNFGIFREPGVHQFFLMLALYLNNYKADWEKQSRMWYLNALLALTLVSTFATGGVAALGLFAVVIFFDKKPYRDPLGRKIIIALAAAGVLLGAYLVIAKPRLYTALYLMINKVLIGDNSANERWESIWVNFHILHFSPYIGRDVAYVLHLLSNNTSSTSILYAIFGVIWGNLNVIAWLCLLWERKRNILLNLLCVVLMFITFNTENFIADPFLWLFPIMAMTEAMLCLGSRIRTKICNKQ